VARPARDSCAGEVRDACVDVGADAVRDGEPVDEDDAAPLVERERPRRAAGVELERPRRLEPGGGCLCLSPTVGCDRLSRYKEQRSCERASIDVGNGGSSRTEYVQARRTSPLSSSASAAWDGDHRRVLAAADGQRVCPCGRCFESAESGVGALVEEPGAVGRPCGSRVKAGDGHRHRAGLLLWASLRTNSRVLPLSSVGARTSAYRGSSPSRLRSCSASRDR
jgi:hypothetical protein